MEYDVLYCHMYVYMLWYYCTYEWMNVLTAQKLILAWTEVVHIKELFWKNEHNKNN